MDAKAPIATHYKWRRGIMAAGCLLFAVWFLYDGAVAYPQQNKLFEQFQQFKEANPDTWRDKWEEHANANGLPLDPTDMGKHDKETGELSPPRSSSDIGFQYVCFAITAPIGLLFLIDLIRLRGRWIAPDGEDALVTSWGKRVEFDKVTRLNLERWRSKGIAVVYFKEGDGETEQAVVLDDWKYERVPMTHMVEDLIDRLDDEQLEGDPGPLAEPPLEDDELEEDEGEAAGEEADDLSAEDEPSERAGT